MEWTMTIPWLISFGSLVFVVLGFAHTAKKDNREMDEKKELMLDGIKEALLKVNMKLDQVCNTTTETRSDFKVMNSKVQLMDKDVESLKRDLATAFVRIDELRDEIKKRVSED